MLDQDLAADQDQNDAAHKLCKGFVLRSEHIAHLHAESGQEEGDDADEGNGGNDGDVRQKCKGHANRQRIDAGSNGKQQHFLEGKRGVGALFLLGEGLPDHVGADEHQKHESDPVVDGGDLLLKTVTDQIAERGHQRLKGAEPESDHTGLFQGDLRGGKALAHGDCESVHGKTDGE